MANKFHIAQLNIAHSKDSADSEVMKSFFDQIADTNALAEKSPGYVWRLIEAKDENAAVTVFNNELMVVNLSVWEDIDSLKSFVYQSVHKFLIKDKAQWFRKMTETHMVLWWINAGEIPSIETAKAKLDLIRKQGPSAEAFTFSKPFSPNDH